MEQNYAILIADLSGYTALTEAHGPYYAADIIDKYIAIVNESLLESCFLHERVGDEVMILAENAKDLLITTEKLTEKLSRENHFLQIHAGMHYGPLLKRGNGYFGTALNLTARIASSSQPGSIKCSVDFIWQLPRLSAIKFKFTGKHRFKNVTTEFETYELITEDRSSIYIDPICRMIVSNSEDAFFYEQDRALRFCSEECVHEYSGGLPFQRQGSVG